MSIDIMNNIPSKEKPWRPNPALTEKENAFVRHTINNPKDSGTETAMQTYNARSRAVAATIAKEVRARPRVAAELAKYSDTAEMNLIKLANASTSYALEGGKDGAAYAGVSERVNNSILDRLHGKATIKVEQQSLAVTINVDLTTETTPAS